VHGGKGAQALRLKIPHAPGSSLLRHRTSGYL
jgi:hypothetical protein